MPPAFAMKPAGFTLFDDANPQDNASRFSNVFYPTTATSARTICDHCKNIDFENINARFDDRKHQNGVKPEDCAHCSYTVCDLGYLEPTSECHLCQFLIRISKGGPFQFANHKEKPDHIVLQAYSSLSLLSFKQGDIKHVKDAPILTVAAGCRSKHHERQAHHALIRGIGKVGDSHYFGLLKDNATPVHDTLAFRNTSGHINWEDVKSYVTFCKTNHQCGYKGPQNVPNLVVIDCESRRLASLPNTETPYLTLSYTWGRGEVVDQDLDGLPSILPQVIEDAIQVVIALGQRYIWVDRYCIPQNNAGEKHRLVQEMGSIYQNSSLTIVAAAGNDPTYGLPGVSVIPRWEVSPISVGDITLVPCKRDLMTTLRNSKWNTRGWTYQEGYLSRRLLLFTNGGLLFQCSAGRFLESISISPEYYQPFDLGDEMFDELLGAETFMEERIGKCISEFSHREFTYDSDVLAAFRGIFGLFKNTPDCIESLCGVAFSNYSSIDAYESTPMQEIINGLMWISWRGTPPATAIKASSYLTLRRTQYPSWTWAGWRFSRADTGSYVGDAFPVSIAVVFHDNTLMDWETNYKAILAREASGCQPMFLRLHAWSFDVVRESLSLRWDAISYCHIMTLMSTTSRSVFKLRVDSSNYPENELLEILHKVVLLSGYGDCLFLRKSPGQAYFERIAIGYLNQGASGGKWKPLEKSELLEITGAVREEIVIG